MMGGKENQDKTALEYWREHWETKDDGRVNNGTLTTKSSICADTEMAREPNTSECNAPNDKITRVGSCANKRGKDDKMSSLRGSHPHARATRPQTVQPGSVDSDETANHNRHTGQAKRNRLEELSKPSIGTSTMRAGIATPRSSKKREHGDSETNMLAWIL